MPTALTKCRVISGVAVGLMAAGTFVEQTPWLKAWALLVAVYAAALFLGATVQVAAAHMEAYIKKWVFRSFEDGFKGGVDAGREIEAAERFIASTTQTDPNA